MQTTRGLRTTEALDRGINLIKLTFQKNQALYNEPNGQSWQRCGQGDI